MKQRKSTQFVKNPDIWPHTRGFNPDKPHQETSSKYNKIIDDGYAELTDCQKLEYKKLQDSAINKAQKLSEWSHTELEQRLQEVYLQEYGAVASNTIVLLFTGLAASMVLIFLDFVSPFYVLSAVIFFSAFLIMVLVNQSFAEGIRNEEKLKIESLIRERDEVSRWFECKGLYEKYFIDSAMFGQRLVLDAFELNGISGTDAWDLRDEEMNEPDSLKYIRAWLDLRMHDELMRYVTWQPRKSD